MMTYYLFLFYNIKGSMIVLFLMTTGANTILKYSQGYVSTFLDAIDVSLTFFIMIVAWGCSYSSFYLANKF